MNSLTNWNYSESVKRVSAKVAEWKAVSLKKSTLTDEIATDLYEARAEIAKVGRPETLPHGRIKTWSSYLEEVGLAYRTVHRWLEHYEPTEQRLLTDDEYANKKAVESRQRYDKQAAIKQQVKDAKQTGVKPAGWDDETEKEYQRQVKEDAERDERIKSLKEETAERTRRREELERERYGEPEDISELLDRVSSEQTKKHEFREKVGLTGDNAFHDFNDMLTAYLETLPSNGEKIEACHNIIKICKGVVSSLQQESVIV